MVKRYDSGESDILVLGTKRIKFTRFIQEVPFLIGEGEFIETEKEMPEATQTQLVTELKQMLISWFFTKMDNAERPIHFFKNVSDLEVITHFIANYFVSDLETKQMILEDNSLESRAQTVWQILKDLSGDDPLNEMPESEVLIFPGADDKKKTPIN